jgi:GT2 family glycosyltransferase
VNVSGTPEISILIVTFNNEATIIDCLKSLLEQSHKSVEILIWDNCSTDITCQQIRQFPRMRLISSQKNIGLAAAINRLAEKAVGKYLFILNPDCLCPPYTLQTLVAFSQSHPGAISPALVFPDGEIQYSARQFPDYKNIIFSRRSPIGLLGLFDSQKAGFIFPDKPSAVPAVSATALFIPKVIFEEIGCFDERFFLYCEDIDLCRKLHNRGISIWYLPDLRVVHLLRVSSQKAPIKSLYYHHRALFKYFTKHNPRGYIKNLILFVMLTGGFLFSTGISVFGKRNKHD